MKNAKRVVIVQKSLAQYRKTFYILLREKLHENNIELVLIYGDGNSSAREKKDSIHITWGHFVPNNIFYVFGKELYWQHAIPYIRKGDFVIVEQASKLLLNYYLQFFGNFSHYHLAFWGHGKNFQAKSENFIAELIKKQVSRHVSWWFAYTSKSRDIVKDLGFSKKKITVVQNSIDTDYLRKGINSRNAKDKQTIRDRYSIEGKNTCIFCGGMYPQKCIDFLIESAKLVRAVVIDFELVFIGSGEDRALVEKAAESFDWIHYLGPLFDQDKIDLFSISKLLLMPGLVGLVVLDSFACGVPIITTDVDFHSPEIDYLESGRNGIVTPHDIRSYSQSVVDILTSTDKYKLLKTSALESGKDFSIEKMVDNFSNGIMMALDSIDEDDTDI